MEDYPSGSLDLNLPLLVVSGLTKAPTKPLLIDPDLREHGILVRSELAPVESRQADTILRYIQAADASDRSWNLRDNPKKYKFRVKTIGREFLLPPRRAQLPELAEPPVSAPVLHSPFSPLSPGSTLYPDGVIDTRWLLKHQESVPSTCLFFYQLSADQTLATLHDNQLKTDVNAVKHALSSSGYKTRVVVVIISDHSPGTMGPFSERLENIRKGTGLDPKTSLFVLPTQRTDVELHGALDSVLNATFEQSVDYFRDLSRHCRKKKSRGITPKPTIPPTTGTSHTLSLQGWNVRYDFKTAVFAEFRQEFDAAQRSYEQAYETLLGTEVMESIPMWSPRFNDARLLADIIAVRILKCLLITGQSVAAVRRWQAHRETVADFIDRRGRGTQNYGWKAWEARWTVLMANLTEKIQFPELHPSSGLLYRSPEKHLAADRIHPWEMLHHAGYWYQAASRHLLDRRKFAHAMPEDDRRSPDASAASQIAAKAYSYDSYMCPEPHEEYPLSGDGVNHTQLILDTLDRARSEFQNRQQERMVVEIALDCTRELERLGEWEQIVELLAPIWRKTQLRSNGWWDALEALGWTLRSAAARAGQGDIVVAIDWELMNKKFSRRSNWLYDLTKSLDGVETDSPPQIQISDDTVTSCLDTKFVFKNEEGKAGQQCPAQLVITSNAFGGTRPIAFESIEVEFSGGLRAVHLKHKERPSNVDQRVVRPGHFEVTAESLVETRQRRASVTDDASTEASSETSPDVVLEATTDLTIHPGHTRVFEMTIPLREPGDAEALAVCFRLAPGPFALNYRLSLSDDRGPGRWYVAPSVKKVTRNHSHQIKVLPRPPKMELKILKLAEQYYANEPVQLELDVINQEDVDADTKLDIHLSGQETPAFKIQVVGESEHSARSEGEESQLVGAHIGTIKSNQSTMAILTLEPMERPMTYDLTVKASYHLVSDPATPIIQLATYHLNIVNPFEASYDLQPRLHPQWPSLFDCSKIQDYGETSDDKTIRQPKGLSHSWSLVTRYASFATEDLIVVDLEVKTMSTQGNIECSATMAQPLPEEGLSISPKTIEEGYFDLVAQKFSLDDRSPSTADLSFIIHWRRPKSALDVVNTTRLAVPRFFVTASEPRVLASVSYSSSLSPSPSSAGVATSPTRHHPPLVFLDLTIENPSSHFLTFGLGIEPSEEFAFSGSKSTTVNVLPVARKTISYRLLPLVRGAWIRPALTVRDKYFQKVLKIIPTVGMKSDKDGFLVWVPPEEEPEDGDEGDEGEEGDEK